MDKSPYETLGVSSQATHDDIKNAYRKLAKKHHPDLNPGNKEAEKRFKEINAAYEAVGTPEAREKFQRGEAAEERAQSEPRHGRGPYYHQTQQAGSRYSQGFEGMDEDLFRSFFDRAGSRGGEEFEHPGQDVRYQMEVDFKDAAIGAEREITLPDGKRLRVKIPAGVVSGLKLRFPGYGSSGSGKAPAGDAYVELKVRPSSLFKRLGDDLEIELPISVTEAILGGEVRTPTIDGSVLLKIPAGVTSGSRLRIAGKGVARPGGKRGDQFAVLKLVVPPNIDTDFKSAVESWSKRQHFDPRAQWAGSSEGRS